MKIKDQFHAPETVFPSEASPIGYEARWAQEPV